MRKIVANSILNAWQSWKILLWVYLMQFSVIAFLGIQFKEILENHLSKSLEINKLLSGFDYTVITDFVHVNGHELFGLMGQLKWFIIAWMVVSIFLNAGQLNAVFQRTNSSFALFWSDSSKLFFAFAKRVFFFLVLFIGWTTLLFFPLLRGFPDMLFNDSSEKYALMWLLIGFIIWLKGVLILFTWSILTRLDYCKVNSSVMRNCKQAWQALWTNKIRIALIVSLYMIVVIVLFLSYWKMQSIVGMTSGKLILYFFICQTGFTMARLFLRFCLYTSLDEIRKL